LSTSLLLLLLLLPQVYLAGAAGPASNLGLLDDMLACRHQLAQLLGYPSYAAFKAADSTLAGAGLRSWQLAVGNHMATCDWLLLLLLLLLLGV
jgi:hypothetical protein